MQHNSAESGEKRILALETSGRRGSLALATALGSHCKVMETVVLPPTQRTAQSLLPEITDLLERLSWKPSQLELICATSGPGSFTGLRIGVTAAKTIAYSTRACLAGVHTLMAMAEQIPDWNQPVWTILDAQREQLFAARHPGQWRSQPDYRCETQLLDIDQWLAGLQPGEVVAGPPLKTLATRVPDTTILAEESIWSPTATAVARIGYSLYCRGSTIDPMQLVPSYYRKSAAEEKADAHDKL